VWGSGGIAPPLFTSALDGEWSILRPGRFIPEERAPVFIGYEAGWAQSQSLRCGEENISLTCARNRTPAVQPTARRYADLAIPGGRAIAQTVSRRLPTAAARVRS
jgi:hypothetical protein